MRETLDPPAVSDSPALHPALSVGIIILTAVVILYLVPRPATVSIQGWRMLAIFVCTILALMLSTVAICAR